MKSIIISFVVFVSHVAFAGGVIVGGNSRVSDLSRVGLDSNGAQISTMDDLVNVGRNNNLDEVIRKMDAATAIYKLSEENNTVKFSVAEPKVGGDWAISTMQGPVNNLTPQIKDALDRSSKAKQWQKINLIRN